MRERGGKIIKGVRKNTMENRKIDSKTTFQVLIDEGWWHTLSLLKAATKKTFRELVEHALSNTYEIGEDGNPREIKNKI